MINGPGVKQPNPQEMMKLLMSGKEGNPTHIIHLNLGMDISNMRDRLIKAVFKELLSILEMDK